MTEQAVLQAISECLWTFKTTEFSELPEKHREYLIQLIYDNSFDEIGETEVEYVLCHEYDHLLFYVNAYSNNLCFIQIAGQKVKKDRSTLWQVTTAQDYLSKI